MSTVTTITVRLIKLMPSSISKTPENLSTIFFWRFQVVWKWNIGVKWVKWVFCWIWSKLLMIALPLFATWNIINATLSILILLHTKWSFPLMISEMVGIVNEKLLFYALSNVQVVLVYDFEQVFISWEDNQR